MARNYELKMQIMPLDGKHTGIGYQTRAIGMTSRASRKMIESQRVTPSIESSGKNSPYLKLPKGDHSRQSTSPARSEASAISFHSFRKKDFAHTTGLKPALDSPVNNAKKFVITGKPVQIITDNVDKKPVRKVPILLDPPFVKQNLQVKRANKHFLSL